MVLWTTHYSYDLSGRLIGIADTTKNGVTDQNKLRTEKNGAWSKYVLEEWQQ
jgi:hypothetical protein